MTPLLLTPTLSEGPSLGAGPVIAAAFATGRTFAVLRRPGMAFTVRWRDPIPGHGTVFLKRRRADRAWEPVVCWVRTPSSCYVYPSVRFAAWKDGLACGLSWLDAWIGAPDWRAFWNESSAEGEPAASLDATIAAFGMAPVAEAGERDGRDEE